MSLRKSVSSLIKRLRRLRKRYLSLRRNRLMTWVASNAALLRRLTLRGTTIIGVTGSCGKTTTTELTGAILLARAPCHVKTGGNTKYAALRSMLRIDRSTPFCVHEVGTSGPGNIAQAVRILRPQVAVVTTIGSDHHRAFRGLEATAREKATLVTALPRSGAAILNADDPQVRAMASLTQARILTYGLSPDADIRATDVSSAWPERLSLTVMHGGRQIRMQTKFVGELWVTSVLAAISCGIECGMSLEDCIEAIEKFEPVFSRCSVHSGPDKSVFVLDTRKAPAWTLPQALAFMHQARAPRKTIVFGTISDYSGKSSARYPKVANEALIVADRVMFVGPNAHCVDKLRTGEVAHRLFSFPTAYQASEFLARSLLPSELILVKASITDHLERVMLRVLDQVVCWQQNCRRKMDCPDCLLYRTPHPPRLGLAHDEGSAVSEPAGATRIAVSEPR